MPWWSRSKARVGPAPFAGTGTGWTLRPRVLHSKHVKRASGRALELDIEEGRRVASKRIKDVEGSGCSGQTAHEARERNRSTPPGRKRLTCVGLFHECLGLFSCCFRASTSGFLYRSRYFHPGTVALDGSSTRVEHVFCRTCVTISFLHADCIPPWFFVCA